VTGGRFELYCLGDKTYIGLVGERPEIRAAPRSVRGAKSNVRSRVEFCTLTTVAAARHRYPVLLRVRLVTEEKLMSLDVS
jgi:hypothetical protein